MRKTHVLPLCFGLTMYCASTLRAEVNTLVLKLNETEEISVKLTDRPKYWVGGDLLYLQTGDELQEFDIAAVKEIIFQDAKSALPDGFAATHFELYPTLATNEVTLKGYEGGEIVVRNIQGNIVPIAIESINEIAKLKIGNLPKGMYTLTYKTTSLKFIKGETVR